MSNISFLAKLPKKIFNLPEVIGVFPKYAKDKDGKLIITSYLKIKATDRPTLKQRFIKWRGVK